MKNKLSDLIKSLPGILFPQSGSCPSCGRVLLHEKYICRRCNAKMKKPEYFCRRCGRITSRDGICVSCETFGVKWDESVSLYSYESPTDAVIWNMKYRNRPFIAEELGKELGKRIGENLSDGDYHLITFIPSSAERMAERGYNQAEILALEVGNALGIPVMEIMSAKDSLHQVGLGAVQRYENALDRFSVNEGADVRGRRIIVVDDVLTTGSTMAAACAQLKSAGAEYILAATVAQTVSFVNESDGSESEYEY